LALKSGNVYVGQFKSSKIHGQGIMLTGDVCVRGQWEDQKLNGHAVRASREGEVYIGEFKNNKREGQGTLVSPDRSKYVG